jgi:signal transduction histidine kinase
VTMVALALAWAIQRQRLQRAALAEANRKLAHYATTIEQLAITQERNRLAREMHDTLAHSLSAASVQLEAVGALWDADGKAARAMLEQVQQVTRNGLTEARRALQALRASPLDDVGLAIAVSNLARSAAARAGLALDLNVPGQLDTLLPDVEQCVFRVAQEALTNVARHAEAKSLRVSLTQADGQLSLAVGDDGRGFDTAAIPETRFGLSGLRERAEMIGGTLVVESVPTRGTTVRLTVRDAKVDLPVAPLSAKL